MADAPFGLAIADPTPVAIQATVAKVDTSSGPSLVMLMVSTPVGASYYFLDPVQAAKVGQAMLDQAKAAQTGLTVVHGGQSLHVPGGN